MIGSSKSRRVTFLIPSFLSFFILFSFALEVRFSVSEFDPPGEMLRPGAPPSLELPIAHFP
jgi:hypothetical protein